MPDHLPDHLPFLDALPAGAALSDARAGTGLDRAGLAAAAAAQARALHAVGVGARDRVVIAPPDPVATVTGLFAAWAVGAVAVPVAAALPGPARARLEAAIGPAARIDTGGVVAVGGPRGARVAGALPRPLAPDDTALMLMTSGTSGAPKGVCLSLRALQARTALNRAHMGADALRQTLAVLPLQFGHGLIGTVLTPLAAGGRVHLMPSPSLAELRELPATIAAGNVTFLAAVPAFWRLVLRLSPPPSRPLQRVHVGSAPLPAGLWHEIADWAGTRAVWNMYGMTEAANWIAGAPLAEAGDGVVGRPWGGAAAILRPDGAVADSGEGELLVQTPALMQGYWKAPAQTAAAWHRGWLRTGDRARIEASGAIVLIGRLSEQINRAGIEIAPEEVEMALERHPDVAEACAFAMPDPVGGDVVGAAIVPRAGTGPTAGDLVAWMAGQVRAEAVPVRVAILPDLPRTDRGKVRRAAVREAALAAATPAR